MLWFDVEKGYRTTQTRTIANTATLWFDVEKGYRTTPLPSPRVWTPLWFDVEKGYRTTDGALTKSLSCCGLM